MTSRSRELGTRHHVLEQHTRWHGHARVTPARRAICRDSFYDATHLYTSYSSASLHSTPLLHGAYLVLTPHLHTLIALPFFCSSVYGPRIRHPSTEACIKIPFPCVHRRRHGRIVSTRIILCVPIYLGVATCTSHLRAVVQILDLWL
jgi:hypothetical protein